MAKQAKKLYSFRLPEDVAGYIRDHAEKHSLSQSDVVIGLVREAIQIRLDTDRVMAVVVEPAPVSAKPKISAPGWKRERVTDQAGADAFDPTPVEAEATLAPPPWVNKASKDYATRGLKKEKGT